MTAKKIEKRANRRAFFTLEDHIGTNILSNSSNGKSNQDRAVPVTLLSISVGGLSVTARRYNFPSIKAGDRLTFTEIQTPQPLGTIDRVEAVVKYVVSDETSIRMALGCEFEKIPDSFKEKIDEFVDGRLKSMGLAY